MSLAVQLGKRKSLHQLPGMMSLCFFFFYFLKTKKWVRKSVAISLSLFSVVFTDERKKKKKDVHAASSGGLQGTCRTHNGKEERATTSSARFFFSVQ
jgi:hypothetical protein